MAEFVACLEDGDRRSDLIAVNWEDVWRRLDRVGDPSESDSLIKKLASAALIEAEPLLVAEPEAGDESGSRPIALRMHPGVAVAITTAAPPGVREAVDVELAAYWYGVMSWTREREDGENSALVVRAGLAGAPYLLRRGEWDRARFLLEQAVGRDASPGVTQVVLPSLRRVAAATGKPVDTAVLAKVLRRVDPAEAERLLRTSVDAAIAAGDYRSASASAGELLTLLRDAGRLREALALAAQKPEFTKRAGLGRWTQLGDEARRLQLLGLMGDHVQVVEEVARLRAVMAELPAARRGPNEAVDPWNIREVILGIGCSSALATREWARCLELNAETVASKRERGAGEHEVTRFWADDAGPLIELGRLDEAGRLLAECQRVFEDHADTVNLGKVLSTRASLESKLGNWSAAADLQRAAVRLSYARPEPWSIAIFHFNLANYLWRLGDDRAGQRTHRLASGLIDRLTGASYQLVGTIRTLADEMGEAEGTDPSLPSTVVQVVELAEQTEGVRLGALLAALEPEPAKIEEALAEILRAAAAPPS